MSTVYTVSLDKLIPAINHVIGTVTSQAMYAATKAVSDRTVEIMKDECPSSIKSGRGRGGVPMSSTVKAFEFSNPSEAMFHITPTKMVISSKGWYKLADILEDGSPGGQPIVPLKTGGMLVFLDRTGRKVITSHVTRGAIPPQRFAKRTYDRILAEASNIMIAAINNVYATNANIVNVSGVP